MENNCGIVGLRDDEIELELGLSIGGSFGKAEKLKPIKKDSKPKSDLVADLGESVAFDLQTKREIQALRRQEAKKKREEKQQKRGMMIISSRGHQKCEARSRDDEVDATEERECKKSKVDKLSGNVNLNLSAERNSPVVPVRVPCPYPQVQYVPLANGFAYSCVNAMPCWGGGAGNEKPPVMGNGGFRPFQAGQDSGLNVGNGYDSDQNSSRDERNRNRSNGSPICSSSGVSDLQSSSNQGGCNSETGTNRSHCQLEQQPQRNCSVASNLKGQSEQSATSHQLDSAQSIDKPRQGIEKTVSLNTTESPNLLIPNEKPKPEIESTLINGKPVLTKETPTATLTKDTKADLGKPPKPKTPTHNGILSLHTMPCVSTTGNGTNGKTVNGFLYRYTKSEVSIICVCHGSSFTPAEFVQHAGGSDVSHPLRNITVIPSAF